MTDVPRRSYPLVVAPPGGFEDAVKRGRRMRLRRAGGSTGAALALVGVLAFSLTGHDTGTSSLEPANGLPRNEESQRPGGPSPTPSAEPAATPPGEAPSATGSPAGPGEQPGHGPDPTSVPGVPGPVETTRPPREEGNPRVYAQRNPIDESDPEAATSTGCASSSVLGQPWCAYARVDTPANNPGSSMYVLHYTLCRQLDAGDGAVQFGRTQEVDFSATDTGNDDTVWTYSAGQPVVPAASTTTIPAGNCVTWTTEWDGYDDFGYTPRAGQYRLRTRSFGTSDAPVPTAEIDFALASDDQ